MLNRGKYEKKSAKICKTCKNSEIMTENRTKNGPMREDPQKYV
jgi:hypothetical protein